MSGRVWIFDFDGTLAPIVPDRDKAVLHEESLRLLNDLAQLSGHKVAILSSRQLDDLAPRVPVKGIFLGGGSGTEWLLPGGKRMTFCRLKKLKEIRSKFFPELERMASECGADLEDKKWSVALHTRHVTPSKKKQLKRMVDEWPAKENVGIFRGPEVIEVLFFPEVNKAFGVRTLCTVLNNPYLGTIVYSGDDENDAKAMRFVASHGGVAITVGDQPLVPSAIVVKDQRALASTVRTLSGLDFGENQL